MYRECANSKLYSTLNRGRVFFEVTPPVWKYLYAIKNRGIFVPVICILALVTKILGSQIFWGLQYFEAVEAKYRATCILQKNIWDKIQLSHYNMSKLLWMRKQGTYYNILTIKFYFIQWNYKDTPWGLNNAVNWAGCPDYRGQIEYF
jgi:hypothetical protein